MRLCSSTPTVPLSHHRSLGNAQQKPRLLFDRTSSRLSSGLLGRDKTHSRVGWRAAQPPRQCGFHIPRGTRHLAFALRWNPRCAAGSCQPQNNLRLSWGNNWSQSESSIEPSALTNRRLHQPDTIVSQAHPVFAKIALRRNRGCPNAFLDTGLAPYAAHPTSPASGRFERAAMGIAARRFLVNTVELPLPSFSFDNRRELSPQLESIQC